MNPCSKEFAQELARAVGADERNWKILLRALHFAFTAGEQSMKTELARAMNPRDSFLDGDLNSQVIDLSPL